MALDGSRDIRLVKLVLVQVTLLNSDCAPPIQYARHQFAAGAAAPQSWQDVNDTDVERLFRCKGGT
jgi:hypothetical protein